MNSSAVVWQTNMYQSIRPRTSAMVTSGRAREVQVTGKVLFRLDALFTVAAKTCARGFPTTRMLTFLFIAVRMCAAVQNCTAIDDCPDPQPGNMCLQRDCWQGMCMDVAVVNCDDLQPCTVDACVTQEGGEGGLPVAVCVHEAVHNCCRRAQDCPQPVDPCKRTLCLNYNETVGSGSCTEMAAPCDAIITPAPTPPLLACSDCQAPACNCTQQCAGQQSRCQCQCLRPSPDGDPAPIIDGVCADEPPYCTASQDSYAECGCEPVQACCLPFIAPVAAATTPYSQQQQPSCAVLSQAACAEAGGLPGTGASCDPETANCPGSCIRNCDCLNGADLGDLCVRTWCGSDGFCHADHKLNCPHPCGNE